MKKYRYPSTLTIAGFDGSGGAGIQADIKTFSALGCYATSVLTALPVQNTMGVRKIYPIALEAVADQIESIMDDVFPDAIKIGMVHTPQLVITIAQTLQKYKKVPLVFDPVMVATSGHKLIEEETIAAMIDLLFPLADVITPNMDEAGILAKVSVETLEDMYVAGENILALGCKRVLVKGGHLEQDALQSILFDKNSHPEIFKSKKIKTKNTHGSGCTLSSAIAAYLAQGHTISEAVSLAQNYVFMAIEQGADVQLGMGNGPLNHFFNPQKQIKYELV